MKKINLLVIAGYLMMWFGGVYAHLQWGGPPAGMDWTATAFLALAGIIILQHMYLSDAVRFLAAGLLGFVAELLGVHTGFPFGTYIYTPSLPPLILGVPIIMVSAWLILAGYISHMLYFLKISRWVFVIAGALWMVGLDLLIDPLAAGPLDYWRWSEKGIYSGIPMTNFIGWFIVSLCVFLVLPHPVKPDRTICWTGWSIVLFFTILAFIYGQIIPGIVGIILTAVHIVCMYGKPKISH